jgi:hypothetical protein
LDKYEFLIKFIYKHGTNGNWNASYCSLEF